MKILCVFGKHQYGDPDRGIGIEYAAFIPALRNLGHEVVHFDSWRRSLYPDYAALNRALLEKIELERPRVLLCVQMNYEIWLETLRIIRNRGDVATVCWTTDDSWKYREVSRFIGREYHAMTTSYPNTVPLYKKDGIPYILLTQWAANSYSLQKPLSAAKCRMEVSFVGAVNSNRKKMISALNEKGIFVSCFGHGWPKGSVGADDIPDIMRNSVISLNFSNSKGENQVKARTFEVPGAGGFLLTQYAPGLENFYLPGKEIDLYDDINSLVEKIRYYLAEHEKRDKIALAGFERTSREHTYEMRLKGVIDFTVRAGNEIPVSPETSCTDFDEAVLTHDCSPALKLLRSMLVFPSSLIWGKVRGPRAARRLIFELSWRFLGHRTFTASGLPGRMFPEQ